MQVVLLLELKEDADGNKTSTVNGIRAAMKIMKTRCWFFESVQLRSGATGMDHSGLFEFLEEKTLTKQGNRYKYITTVRRFEFLKIGDLICLLLLCKNMVKILKHKKTTWILMNKMNMMLSLKFKNNLNKGLQ